LIVLCIAPLLIGSSAWNQQLQNNFQNNIKENGGETAEIANEAIKQIRTVSALNKQTYFEDKFYKANETIHKFSKHQAFTSSIGFGFLQSSAMFANAVGFFAGAKLIIKN
jgi:ABC-type bacteriocin/lantibiotic exporter with double-glycine peptidase domain